MPTLHVYTTYLGYLPRRVPWVAGRPGQGEQTAFLCHVRKPREMLPFSRIHKAFQDIEQGAVQLAFGTPSCETKLFRAHNCSLLRA